MQLLVYTSNITSRKEYIFDFILNRILGISYLITNNAEEFLKTECPKISYSVSSLSNELCFLETPLLSQSGFDEVELSFASYENYKVPFPVQSGVFPFDVFAASFYLLTRYEEYKNPLKDNHGRFEAKSSLAYNNGFLFRPVIDEWAFKILHILQEKFPQITHKKRNFLFKPTLDIDHAYYIKTEGIIRILLKYLKLVLKRDWKSLKNDPFDVYKQVELWDKEYALKTTFFILMGSKHLYDGVQDKNHKVFKKLINHLAKHFLLGLHPSYSSNENPDELALEKTEMEQIISREVTISRQHYLKLDLPKTYQNLLNNNIKEDYTMVYADLPGFRASTCSSFFWYNLEEETITNLLIHPTTVMDQTLKRYMGLSKQEAIKELKTLIESVKNVEGTFVSLWHNESISDFAGWKGWQRVYLEMLKMNKF